ncbi:IpaC/SipC family type III secretion system effector [Chromobacterium vaccinii]|uniref:Effector protein BipC n=1 Tax=Chromobacterium vaccinii TaxID=1108595 RepID=A0ABV0F5Y8_9NEIS
MAAIENYYTGNAVFLPNDGTDSLRGTFPTASGGTVAFASLVIVGSGGHGPYLSPGSPDLTKPTVKVTVEITRFWDEKLQDLNLSYSAESISKKLDDPSFDVSGMSNALTMIMILLVDVMSKIRAANSKMESKFIEISFAAAKHQAADIRQQGMYAMTAAFVQGGVQISMSFYGAKLKNEGLNGQQKALGEKSPDYVDAKKLEIRGEFFSTSAQGFATIFAAPINLMGTYKQAEAIMDEAIGKSAGTVAQNEQEQKKGASEQIQNLINQVREIFQNIAATMGEIAGNIRA